MYNPVINLEVANWCQEKCLKSLPRSQMPPTAKLSSADWHGHLTTGTPIGITQTYCHMVGANYLKIVCFLWSKCEYSVHIYFILLGNQSFSFTFSSFFVFVSHERENNMCEIDLLNINGLLNKSGLSFIGASFSYHCLYFPFTQPLIENQFIELKEVGEILKFNHVKFYHLLKISICYVLCSQRNKCNCFLFVI